MHPKFKAAALSAALTAFASLPVSADWSGSLQDFITAGTVVQGIYTYTYVSASAGLLAYANDADVNIGEFSNSTGDFTSIQLSDLSGLTNRGEPTYTFEYTIELYAGAPLSNPDDRFGTIGLGADISSNPALTNIGTTKHIVGQVTPLVPAPTFDETLETTPTTLADSAYCGECRKFLVTDTIDMTYNDGNPRGNIRSISNDYDNVEIPVPGTLALLGLGLSALGARTLRRKA